MISMTEIDMDDRVRRILLTVYYIINDIDSNEPSPHSQGHLDLHLDKLTLDKLLNVFIDNGDRLYCYKLDLPSSLIIYENGEIKRDIHLIEHGSESGPMADFVIHTSHLRSSFVLTNHPQFYAWTVQGFSPKPNILVENAPVIQIENPRDSLDRLFDYHPPTPSQVIRYEELRRAAKDFAKIVVANCPDGVDRNAAICKIREALMTANAAIACGEDREH